MIAAGVCFIGAGTDTPAAAHGRRQPPAAIHARRYGSPSPTRLPPAAVLPETQLLLENDNLFPGQNRSQAMALEAETGHLTPDEDAVLLPVLRARRQQARRRMQAHSRGQAVPHARVRHPQIIIWRK